MLSLLLGLAINIAKSFQHLPGIEAESNEGEELMKLWEDKESFKGIEWGAVISDYSPDADNDLVRLGLTIGDLLFVDNFFGEPNDLVIPVASSRGDQAKGFHIKDPNFFSFPSGTNHLEYITFKKNNPGKQGDKQIQEIAIKWLTEDIPKTTI